MEIILDGNKIKSVSDFHHQIKAILEFPDYYGENLDALWDLLTGYIELPMTLVWINFETSKRSLGNYTERLSALFSEDYLLKRGFVVIYR